MQPWRSEFNRLAVYVALGGLLGWLVGETGWGVAIAALLFNLFSFRGARHLAEWILVSPDRDPPDSGSLWGTLYDHLYQREKQSQTRIDTLQGMVEMGRKSTNALRDAIVVVNAAGDLEWWNDAAQRLFGFRRETDRGQPVTNLLRDPRFVRYFRQRVYDGDLDIPSPIHRTVMLNIQIAVFGENNRLIIARDITRLHNLEQTRKDFVANVSHELRTPLTVIKGYLETFSEMVDPSKKAMVRGLQQMQDQTQRMEMLVSDLLLLSKLETQGEKKAASAVDVAVLLRQIHSDALVHAQPLDHEVTLVVDSDDGLNGHADELRSAFSNVVINAVKYTPQRGRIELRWWTDDTGGHFAVTDNGVGIEEQHIPRLTERFYRADASRNSKTGGTGLGLAIVKHVLLHHDATLEIQSAPGQGSVFTCHFPPARLVPHVAAAIALGPQVPSGQMGIRF